MLEMANQHETKLRRLTDDQIALNNKYAILTKKIPRQLPKGKVHKVVMSIQNKVAEVAQQVTFANFLVNLLTFGSLNALFSSINAQQIIIMQPLVNVPLPANTSSFLEKIYAMSSFEIYKGLGDDYNRMLGL